MIFTLLALFAVALCTIGFDHSYYQGAVSVSSYQCLINSGFSFAILQAQTSDGYQNGYGPTQYWNAKSAGLYYIDWYIFPNVWMDAAGQIADTINWLYSNGMLSDNMIWIDVESPGLFYSSCSDNIAFLHRAIDQARAMYNGCGNNNCIGMYTSQAQWDPICCGTTEFSDMQLWWPRYDYSPSSANWSSFGGWGSFNIKQYSNTEDICGTQIDRDWY